MVKELDTFQLPVEGGSFNNCEIVVLLGENGCGKSTLIKMLTGIKGYTPDEVEFDLPKLFVSYKPQTILPSFNGTVEELLCEKIPDVYAVPQFVSDVIKPLKVDILFDNDVQKLSGGELQRVALTVALGKKAKVYFIDEPSAYLDAEQRITASKVIKRFVLNSNKTAFIVEHDFIMASYLADKVIVFEGTPAIECVANPPCTLLEGMNKFLEMMSITFRRDSTNYRPRINKMGSVKDQEQKKAGKYFYYDEV